MSRGSGHARAAQKKIEAIGFIRDPEASAGGRWVYRHPIDPERPVKIWSGMSEAAARKVTILADDIAGLSSHGESMPKTIGERAKIKRKERKRAEVREAEQRARSRTPFDQAAELRDALTKAEARDRESREIRSLMRPKGWA